MQLLHWLHSSLFCLLTMFTLSALTDEWREWRDRGPGPELLSAAWPRPAAPSWSRHTPLRDSDRPLLTDSGSPKAAKSINFSTNESAPARVSANHRADHSGQGRSLSSVIINLGPGEKREVVSLCVRFYLSIWTSNEFCSGCNKIIWFQLRRNNGIFIQLILSSAMESYCLDS